MRALLLVFAWFLTASVQAATVDTTLYILRDSIAFENGVKLPYATFNFTPVFDQKNARIEVNLGDQLVLKVINMDVDSRQFAIKGEVAGTVIPAGDTITVNYTCSTSGAFIFHDPTNFPDVASTGLAGMLVVKDHNHTSFFWNIKEHQEGWNETVFNGGSVDWSTYYPEYFTINGNSHPNINNDPDARVIGSVGDTLMVYLVNTGQSIHSMHFHGYHLEIKHSSYNPLHVGRSKDSFAVFPSETLVLQLIPDKEGEYPVHDHNLIGTTGGSLYPMGMMTTLLITP